MALASSSADLEGCVSDSGKWRLTDKVKAVTGSYFKIPE